jgi:hypothetical protein
MIISASFRTDIPAFYGEWFLRRLEAEHCLVKNPYDGKPFSVSLKREHVDGFFFWTKNLEPFVEKLGILKKRAYPFIVSYSITGDPRVLERSVVSTKKAADHLRRVAGEYGSRCAVWRYDPILITSLTDFDFHRRNFDRLAREIAGSTDEVVVSFAEMYRKTSRNLEMIATCYRRPPPAAAFCALAALHGGRRPLIVPAIACLALRAGKNSFLPLCPWILNIEHICFWQRHANSRRNTKPSMYGLSNDTMRIYNAKFNL